MGTNGGGDPAVRDLNTLFDVGVTGGLSDGELLDRFVARREGAVFEAIVRRHGPMVWGVCRRVLRDHHDGEDAFQATFHVLARRAESVRPREKLAPWLYGVAYHTALKARMTRARRRVREIQVPELPEPEAARVEPPDEFLSLLDRALIRLPEKYRAPIVLCELEGKTHREAAEQLGWPVGTVSGRLSRGRTLLARRMARPGLAIVGGVLVSDAEAGALPGRLAEMTAQAASRFAAGRAGAVSAEVAVLTREVLKMMKLSKVVGVASVLVGLSFVGGTGLVYWSQAAEEGGGKGSVGPPAHQQAPADGAGGPEAEFTISYKGVNRTTQQAADGSEAGLPGITQVYVRGNPGKSCYVRSGNLYFILSPAKDKFSIYDSVSKRATTVQLPVAEGSPTHVVSALAGDDLIALSIGGAKVNRIHVFSLKDWKWYGQDLKEVAPVDVRISLGRSVAAYAQGGNVYAFSSHAKRWGVMDLPEGFSAKLSVFADSVVVEGNGQSFEFRGDRGEWTHTDLRPVIDSAIKAAEDVAK